MKLLRLGLSVSTVLVPATTMAAKGFMAFRGEVAATACCMTCWDVYCTESTQVLSWDVDDPLLKYFVDYLHAKQPAAKPVLLTLTYP